VQLVKSSSSSGGNVCNVICAAVRENRTRGGRNKFGPLYRRDRALRRLINGKHDKRLQDESADVMNIQYLNSAQTDCLEESFVLHDDEQLDMKPDISELALREPTRHLSYDESEQNQSRTHQVSSDLMTRRPRDSIFTATWSQPPSYELSSQRMHSMSGTIPYRGRWRTGPNSDRLRSVANDFECVGGRAPVSAHQPYAGINSTPSGALYVGMSNVSARVSIPVSDKREYYLSGLDAPATHQDLPVFNEMDYREANMQRRQVANRHTQYASSRRQDNLRATTDWHDANNDQHDSRMSQQDRVFDNCRQRNVETRDGHFMFEERVLDQRLQPRDVHSRLDYQETMYNSFTEQSKRDVLRGSPVNLQSNLPSSLISAGQSSIAGSLHNDVIEMRPRQFETLLETSPPSQSVRRLAYDGVQQVRQYDTPSCFSGRRLTYEGGLQIRQSEAPSSVSIRRLAYEDNRQTALSESSSSLSARRLAYEESIQHQITNNIHDQILQSARQEDPGQYDVAVAETVPAALQLIADLRGDSSGDMNMRLQNAVEDILRKYLRDNINSSETTERENSATATRTKDMIQMACLFCDQALFLLVEWARRAHFFRQLTVCRFFLKLF